MYPLFTILTVLPVLKVLMSEMRRSALFFNSYLNLRKELKVRCPIFSAAKTGALIFKTV